jgi:hypothetical protein
MQRRQLKIVAEYANTVQKKAKSKQPSIIEFKFRC